MKRQRDQFDPPRNSLWRYVAWLSAAVTVWSVLFGVTTPDAGAAPCVNRSAAHAIDNGTTVAGDSRYHVLRGELPTCGVDSDSGYRPTIERDTGDRDGGKSRYCRKRWWC